MAQESNVSIPSKPQHSTSEDKMKDEFQRKFSELVDTHLSDLKEVHNQLSKDRGTPQSETILNILLKTFDQDLKFFDASPLDPPNSSHSFFLWLLLHLLRILSSEKCRPLHPLTVKCITGLYHICSQKDLKLFGFIVKEAVELLKCLAFITANVVHFFKDEPSLVGLQHFYYSPRTKRKETIDLTPRPIELTSFLDCSYLTSALLCVLMEQSTKINLFASSVEGEVLQCLAVLMKHGGTPVKKFAVKAFHKFLSSGWVIQPHVVDTHISNAIALAEFSVRHAPQDHKGVLKVMDEELMKLLYWFFMCSDHVKTHHWTGLSRYLCCYLATRGLQNMSPESLRTVGTLVDAYVGRIASESSLVELGRVSFDSLGKSHSLQLVVSPLVQLCRMRECAGPGEEEGGQQTPPPANGDEPKPAKKPKTVKLEGRSVMTPPSVGVTFSCKIRQLLDTMVNKLMKLVTRKPKESSDLHLIENVDWNEVLCLLEGIRVVMETHARLCMVGHCELRPQEPWWTLQQLSHIANVWEWVIAAAILKGGTPHITMILTKVYQSIGALRAAAVWGSLQVFPVVCDYLTSLLLLCWPSLLDKPWDAIVSGSKLPVDMRSQMLGCLRSHSLDLNMCKIESVLAMSALPANAISLQSTQMLRAALFTSECEELRVAAIRTLPLWLASRDEAFCSQFTRWTSDLVEGFPQMSCDVAEALCSTLGAILASVSPPGVSHLAPTKDWDVLVHSNTAVHLSTADGQWEQSDLHQVVCGWVMEITSLIHSHSDDRVKIALLSSVETITKCLREGGLVFRKEILKFFWSQSRAVLNAVGNVIRFLLQGGYSEVKGHIMDALAEAYQFHLESNCISAREGIVNCFGQVGLHSKDSALNEVVMEMVRFLEDPSCTVRATTAHQIKEITRCHGYTIPMLFDLIRVELSEYLAERIHSNPKVVLNTSKQSSLAHQIIDLFSFDKEATVTHLLEATMQFLYPRLVYLSVKTPSQGLDCIAQAAGKSTKELLVLQIKYIFAYFSYTCTSAEFTMALQFLEDVLKVNINQILEKDPVSVMNELCVCVSLSPEQVKNSMLHVVRACQPSCVTPGTSRDELIVQFMKPLLLGELAVLNSKFLMASKQKNEKMIVSVIESLLIIVELMGAEHITPLRVNVMGMLRLAIQEPYTKVVQSGLRAWNCFVRSLEKECLGLLLSQIVVMLLPLVDQHPQQVVEILTYLIVDNRVQLSQYFGEIYSLPDHPALEDVRKVFKEMSSASPATSNLTEQVNRILKGATHEQPAVRLNALEHLANVLKENSEVLNELVIGHDSVAPVISELFTVLMKGSRDPDKAVRVKIGECLGQLGAVDPGKLGLSLQSDDVKPVQMYEIDGSDGEFAVNLLQELIRSFLAATTTRAQDCSAYAMQEILKEYDCTSSDKKSLGNVIWKKLSEENQAILRPFLSSQYNTERRPSRSVSLPIYRGWRKYIFKEWISKFTVCLIQKVHHQRASRIFNACSYTFNHSPHIVLFLFPHALACVLRQERDTCSKGACVADQVLVEMQSIANDMGTPDAVKERSGELTHGCQTLFTALDHLQNYVRVKTTAAAPQRVSSSKASASAQTSVGSDVDKVMAFLKDLPMEALARAAFACKAYARALRYTEEYLRDNREDRFQNSIGFLQNVYAALDEPDGVAGLSSLRKAEANLEEKVLELEIGGQYSEATSYYNMAIQTKNNELSYFQGLLRCNMEMGQLTSVMMHVQGLKEQRPEWLRPLTDVRVEAAWRLGKWKDLEEILDHENSSGSWSIGLGRVLLAAKQKNSELFTKQLYQVRSEQMNPLSVASMEAGSYQRGYEYIVRLHMLQELEEGGRSLLGLGGGVGRDLKKKLVEEWKTRLAVTQTSYRTREPILSLRRLLYSLADNDYHKELGGLWLQSSGMARRTGLLETAGNSLRMAEVHALPELYLERARLLYAKGDIHQALLDLQKSIKDKWPSDLEEASKRDTAEVHAKALLYMGLWMEETAHYDTQTILKQYKSVVAVCPQMESGHFYLAKYYERLMNLFASDKVKKAAEFLRFVLTEYGHALRYGNKYIYQSIPRLLTLWLDFGAKVPDAPPTSSRAKAPDRPALVTTLASLNNIIAELSETLPSYHFLIAFSQLISRICHPNSDVFTQIQAIILKLIQHYPQQSLWMMMAVSKSTHKDRQTRCQRILTEAKRSNSGLENLIVDMMRLTEHLLSVSNKKVDVPRLPVVVSMDKLCRSLCRLANDGNFTPIIVPVQSSLTVTLPLDGGGRYDNLNPFPGNQPTIVKFEDKVEVMASLVRPKKITILGSDGQKYVMMCKPDDDLRKDSRLMEFYTLINKCLRKDPESRRRNLYIRTYSVVPLNEKCGLIEWVPNTSGLRHILNKIYQEKGLFMSGMDIKELWKSKMTDPTHMKKNFEDFVLPKFPAVFDLWFQRTFPDPTQWYSSRLAYSRTSAVMCIVGYILGLGDRHGENILFDSTSGDCIHVDFNCLFNRGKTFDVPECVPFRLTHNLVKAMGVTGYDGVFRKSCEVTMQVLRDQCDPLMCVLKTFIHDPLVEWSKVKGSAESVQDRAMTIIKDIEDRMNGKGNNSKVPPLSIAGQVHLLIQDATSLDNLSKMYVGWAAYL